MRAAFVAAAAVLGALVAAAWRVAPPGRLRRLTPVALALATAYVALSLVWRTAFEPVGLAMFFAAMPVSVGLAVWWAITLADLLRDGGAGAQVGSWRTGLLVRAWACLLVLLPGLFAWVWSSRVEWLVF